MNALAITLAAALVLPVFAHDEGHGPKLTDAGKMGGVITAVVLAKDAKLGSQAPLQFKAELTRSEAGIVRIYLYDKKMVPLDRKRFGTTAQALLQAQVKKKWTSTPFPLNFKDGAFTGKAPKASRKPFNIDVTFKEGATELLAAFDNLD